jgi:hypothetical protein
MRSGTLALVALMLVSSRGRADTLSGTKASEMYDRGNTIEVRIDRGHATLVVTRVFENRFGKHDQAMLHMTELPDGAVATGLRSLGGDDKKPIWFVAELLDAEVAAKKYRELTGIGGYYPKDPALLSWRSQGHLALQVFPVAPKSQKTVEITFEMPTHFVHGKHVIELPRMGTDGLAPTVTFKPSQSSDTLSIQGTNAAAGEMRRLFGTISAAIAPADPPKLGGRFASVSFAKGRAVVHAAVEVSPKLSQVPKGAYVVVVLDGSRSLSDAQRAAELAATRAYLAHLPDAKVQILVFNRRVDALQPQFVSVPDALASLKAITPRNGSDLDLALAEAGKRILGAPAGAPRRIVAMTDLATRSTLLPSSIKGLDATKAVVHLATIQSGKPSVSRDDYEPWAAVARATGGVLWHAHASADLAANKPIYEEWARPLRIDRVSATGVGMTGVEIPDSLAEGEAFEETRINNFPTPSLEVKGELWSTPISTVLSTSASEERLWSALVMGSEVLHELKDPEIATLAFKGGAVSPMTSYLAIEPGVRPSTEGLEWGSGGLGLMGIGAGGGGIGSGIGLGKFVPDRNKILREKLAAVAKTCGATEGHVRLETTWREIVVADVTADPVKKTCLTDGVFDLELPVEFDQSWASFNVELGQYK